MYTFMIFVLLLKTIINHKFLFFQRPLRKSSPRIQRFLLQLQSYNFQFSQISGNQLLVVDMLNRLPLTENTSEIKSDEINHFVHCIMKSCQNSKDRLQQIVTETQKANMLQQPVLQIQNAKQTDRSRYDESQTTFNDKRFTYFI